MPFDLKKWEEGTARRERERDEAREQRWREIRERCKRARTEPNFFLNEVESDTIPKEMP